MMLPRRHSSTKARTFASRPAASSASGCSAATATKVTPMIVSARVVKTLSSPVFAADVVREREVHALAAADPVRLHRAHAVGPFGQLVERREQLVRVLRDPQVVHRDLALLDQRAGAPAAAVDHLLVREHGLVDRVPVDRAGRLVGDAALEHPQEQPLVPLVVVGVAGRELARPVDAEAERLELALHVRDVVARPLRGRDAVLDRGVLGRQAEGVPAHRLQDVVALHAHVAGQHVADGVVAHVAHVQLAARVREHAQAVVLRPRGVFARGERAGGVPFLPGRRARCPWVRSVLSCELGRIP